MWDAGTRLRPACQSLCHLPLTVVHTRVTYHTYGTMMNPGLDIHGQGSQMPSFLAKPAAPVFTPGCGNAKNDVSAMLVLDGQSLQYI